ncbi:hypothetical protein [Pedomonas mirosovicensis]|uniref:hypothetical protein n=1 Tax=Pedomonas mirosovicensis TaxID=2908641 RepID=UPI002166F737|nr:hypothetical protein [Pedomonas mirosovicensis]MCH8683761.1 hypothetical protein [Pedomonas mirosovicensis]
MVTALLVLCGATAQTARAQDYMRPVVKVPGTAANLSMPDNPPPPPADKPAAAPLSPEDDKVQCISIDEIRDAVIRNDRTIHLRMRGNVYYEMRLQNTCPGLSFYDGFYYRTTPNRQLCGGLDVIMARSGSRCPIESFTRIEKPRRGDADSAPAAAAKAGKKKAGERKG